MAGKATFVIVGASLAGAKAAEALRTEGFDGRVLQRPARPRSYRGFAPTWDQVVYRGDKDRRELIVFWLDHGLVVAGMNVNVWGSGDKIAALVFPPRRVDPKALADPSADLASLAVGS